MLVDIPDPLPPAITLPRTVIEFLVDQDLDEFGDTGLVARTWHWILRGGGPGPISHVDWSQFDGDGPPSPRKAPPTSRPCTRPPHGPSSTRPGTSAGCAPPFPATKFPNVSDRGRPRGNLLSPRSWQMLRSRPAATIFELR
jgi:hypothetical protein